MHREPVEDTGAPAKVDSSHPAAIVEVLVPAFQFLAALPEEPLASFRSHAPPIGVYGLSFPLLSVPPLAAALRFRAVRPHSRVTQIGQALYGASDRRVRSTRTARDFIAA
jgi:hypothetical protein